MLPRSNETWITQASTIHGVGKKRRRTAVLRKFVIGVLMSLIILKKMPNVSGASSGCCAANANRQD
ncbi:hypothetical protein HUU40_09395 [candidate division KSB1 bacterium]|nr:hypothetical protein [candidate division KSB1 bacterium]